MIGRSPHRSSPTELDVDKDVILYLVCLPDGDVRVRCLDVGIRCLECGQVLDEEYVTDGFEELFHDDADIDKDVCVTDGAVEL